MVLLTGQACDLLTKETFTPAHFTVVVSTTAQSATESGQMSLLGAVRAHGNEVFHGGQHSYVQIMCNV